MKRLILSGVSALMLLAGASATQAAPALIRGVDHPGDAVLQKAQYLYLGHSYCWYDGGWHGPGFYWCGYAGRRGYGWGGPVGWRGWMSGPGYWRGGAWIGPRGYAHPEWGGWHDHHHH